MMTFRQQIGEFGRWSTCFMLVLVAHLAAGAVALMARTTDNDLASNPPVITLELAPIPAAPEVPQDVAVGPQQVETPEVETPPPPPPPEVVAIEPPKPPAKPPERKKVAKLTTAPAPAEKRAPVAAPASGASGSNAIPNWKSSLVAGLERSKRYPSAARGDQGVAQLAFNVDRNGGVHNARIVRSSGSNVLDSETLALARRVSPLPPPPPEVRGAMIPIVVPIRYNVR